MFLLGMIDVIVKKIVNCEKLNLNISGKIHRGWEKFDRTVLEGKLPETKS